MCAYDVSIACSSNMLPDGWPAEPFWGSAWLSFYEDAIVHTPRYLLLTRDGEAVGAAVCGLDTHLYLPYPAGAVRRLVQRFFRPRVLAVELPALEQPGVWLRPDYAAEATPRLADALLALAVESHRPLILMPYLDAQPQTTCNGWTGYLSQPAENDACMAIEAASLEDYLAGLPRDMRQDLRRTPRAAERAGLHVERIAPDDRRGPQLLALMAQVHHHFDEGTLPFLPGVLTALARLPYAALRIVHDGGRIYACGALLADGAVGTLKFFGLDYAARFHRLQALLYLAAIEDAIGAGVRRLWLGTTHAEEKTKVLGAVPVPRMRRASGRGWYRAMLYALGMR